MFMPNNADTGCIGVSFFLINLVTESEAVGIQPKSAMGITFQVNGSENVVKQTQFTMQMDRMVTSYD